MVNLQGFLSSIPWPEFNAAWNLEVDTWMWAEGSPGEALCFWLQEWERELLALRES